MLKRLVITNDTDNTMKKNTSKWTCIKNCGSCCRLAPEERPEAIDALTEVQRRKYFDLVGQDGWCINYDKSKRECKIYSQRPDFCRVENLTTLFSYKKSDKDRIAISFCKQHIKSVYGGKSTILKRYNKKLRDIS